MSYMILRFYRDGSPREEIEAGLTLEEAQAHCRDDSTSTDEYFDGYESE
jgi:hypothetical protein